MSINHKQIKEELLNRIRNADIISVSERGQTTTTDNFSGDNVETEFTLTNQGIKNIREVKVNSVVLTPLVDYVYTLTDEDNENKKINFTTAPIIGTDNIEIKYDYGSKGDRIYDDFAKLTLTEEAFPRIGFDIISESTNLESFDRVLYQSELLFSFVGYGVGKNQTEEISNDLRDFLITNREDLQRLRYLEPRSRGGLKPFDVSKDTKMFRKNCDFASPFEFETV